MKIIQVSYLKTFPLGQFINEKIEIVVSIGEGDDVQSALSLARSECELNHRNNNPHLYQEQIISSVWTEQPIQETTLTKYPPQPHPKKSLKEIYTQEINQCNTLDQLLSWEIMVKSNTELQEAYNLKLKQLTNG